METLQESHKQICATCKVEVKIKRGYCSVCGNAYGSVTTNNPRDASPVEKITFARFAVYAISGLNFLLGIMEGFVENHSTAMVVNLSISLLVLSLIPRTNQNPLSTLLLCIGINLVAQTLFPLMYLFPFDQWLWIKVFLVIIPVGAILLRLTRKTNQH